MKYKRILLKLSGESLAGEQSYGIDAKRLSEYAQGIAETVKLGCQMAIVVGGGNIFRGLQGAAKGMDRVQGDYMGMMATMINSMAIQAELIKIGIEAEILSGLAVDPICAKMSSSRAIRLLTEGKVVLIAGGTGNPFFTTDSGAALRAAEIKADALLKGTRVDGVYNADPEKDPRAVKYNRLTFDQAYKEGLKIMDLTAFTLCKENSIPIYVFNMDIPGNLHKVVSGQDIGTVIEI